MSPPGTAVAAGVDVRRMETLITPGVASDVSGEFDAVAGRTGEGREFTDMSSAMAAGVAGVFIRSCGVASARAAGV